MDEKECPSQPLVGLVVEKSGKPPIKPKLIGIELTFYIGRRIVIAIFATIILIYSLFTFKTSNTPQEQMLAIENREEPNLMLSFVAIYLLGVATDLDLTFPLKLLSGKDRATKKEDDA